MPLTKNEEIDIKILNSLLNNTIENLREKYGEIFEFEEIEEGLLMEYSEYLTKTYILLEEMENYIDIMIKEEKFIVVEKKEYKKILKEIELLKKVELNTLERISSNGVLSKDFEEKQKDILWNLKKLKRIQKKLNLKSEAISEAKNNYSGELVNQHLIVLLEIKEIDARIEKEMIELKKGREATITEKEQIQKKISQTQKKLNAIIIKVNKILLLNTKMERENSIYLGKEASILEDNYSKTKILILVGIVLSVVLGIFGSFFAEFIEKYKSKTRD